MKVSFFYFHSDNDNGTNVNHYATREALTAALHACVESYDAERAARMRALPFESEEWRKEWAGFIAKSALDLCYFTYGQTTLDIPNTRPLTEPKTKLEGLQNFVRMIVNRLEEGEHRSALYTAVDLLEDLTSNANPYAEVTREPKKSRKQARA